MMKNLWLTGVVAALAVSGCCWFCDYNSQFAGKWNFYYRKDGALAALPVKYPPVIELKADGTLVFFYRSKGREYSKTGLWTVDREQNKLIISRDDGADSTAFTIVGPGEATTRLPSGKQLPDGAEIVIKK